MSDLIDDIWAMGRSPGPPLNRFFQPFFKPFDAFAEPLCRHIATLEAVEFPAQGVTVLEKRPAGLLSDLLHPVNRFCGRD